MILGTLCVTAIAVAIYLGTKEVDRNADLD